MESTPMAVGDCRLIVVCVFEMVEVAARALVMWQRVEVDSGRLLVGWQLWGVKSVATGIPDLEKTQLLSFLGFGGNRC